MQDIKGIPHSLLSLFHELNLAKELCQIRCKENKSGCLWSTNPPTKVNVTGQGQGHRLRPQGPLLWYGWKCLDARKTQFESPASNCLKVIGKVKVLCHRHTNKKTDWQTDVQIGQQKYATQSLIVGAQQLVFWYVETFIQMYWCLYKTSRTIMVIVSLSMWTVHIEHWPFIKYVIHLK